MPFVTIFNFLLLKYSSFFDILPHKMLDYMQGSANIFGKSQTVNILGFVSSTISVATTQSAFVTKK